MRDRIHELRRQAGGEFRVLAVPWMGSGCIRFPGTAVVVLVHRSVHGGHDCFRNPGHEAVGNRQTRSLSGLAICEPDWLSVDLLLPDSGISVPVGSEIPVGGAQAGYRSHVRRAGLAIVRIGLRVAPVFLHILWRTE